MITAPSAPALPLHNHWGVLQPKKRKKRRKGKGRDQADGPPLTTASHAGKAATLSKTFSKNTPSDLGQARLSSNEEPARLPHPKNNSGRQADDLPLTAPGQAGRAATLSKTLLKNTPSDLGQAHLSSDAAHLSQPENKAEPQAAGPPLTTVGQVGRVATLSKTFLKNTPSNLRQVRLSSDKEPARLSDPKNNSERPVPRPEEDSERATSTKPQSQSSIEAHSSRTSSSPQGRRPGDTPSVDPLIKSCRTPESAIHNKSQAEPSPEALTAPNPSSSSKEGPLHPPLLDLPLEPSHPASRDRLLDLPIDPSRTILTEPAPDSYNSTREHSMSLSPVKSPPISQPLTPRNLLTKTNVNTLQARGNEG